MKHQSLSSLRSSEFARINPPSPASVRRSRLERLAEILDNHSGPIRLFSRVEAVPGRRRQAMRQDLSPFAIAYLDPVFRATGLKSDTIGDACAFFGLTSTEGHELVCDCHYYGPVNGHMVAHRARSMAASPSIGARCRMFAAQVANWVAR